jgi:hypothetical protein
MGSFFRSQSLPVQPELLIYELDHRDPLFSIDHSGQLWRKPSEEIYNSNQRLGDIAVSPPTPSVLFADIPVMIHTIYGFSIAPLDQANDRTGPEPPSPRPITPDPGTAQ